MLFQVLLGFSSSSPFGGPTLAKLLRYEIKQIDKLGEEKVGTKFRLEGNLWKSIFEDCTCTGGGGCCCGYDNSLKARDNDALMRR